jgi:acetyl esterase/lipase
LNDCESAVEHFLTVEHRRFGVDPNKVVLMGDSAGGNLVAVVAQRFRVRSDLPAIKVSLKIFYSTRLSQVFSFSKKS